MERPRPSHGPQALTSSLATCPSRQTAAETKDKRNGTRPPPFPPKSAFYLTRLNSSRTDRVPRARALVFRRPTTTVGLILGASTKTGECGDGRNRPDILRNRASSPPPPSSSLAPSATRLSLWLLLSLRRIAFPPIVLPPRVLLSHSRIPVGPPRYPRGYSSPFSASTRPSSGRPRRRTTSNVKKLEAEVVCLVRLSSPFIRERRHRRRRRRRSLSRFSLSICVA